MNARFSRHVQVGASAMEFIPHTLKRMQKRGISEELVSFLIDYGARTYSYNGRSNYIFSRKHSNIDVPKALREKLRHHPGVVVEGDKVITVQFIYKRMKTKPGRRKSRQQRRRI